MSDLVKLEQESISAFILAGKAVFTIRNPKTDKSFTYKIRAAKNGSVHFVSVLTGCNNESDYSYIGFIKDGTFIHGRDKSTIKNDTPSVKAFGWFMINRNNLGPVECYRSNHCARCGRRLTVASSIMAWLGPECAKMVA